MEYKCQFCRFTTSFAIKYVYHCKMHMDVNNIMFPCNINKCSRKFSNYNYFRNHVFRDHSHLKRSNLSSDLNLVCPQLSCNNRFDNRVNLIKHIKIPMNLGEKLACPFINCGKMYDKKKSSFSSHLARCHSNQTNSLISDDVQNKHSESTDSCRIDETNCQNIENQNIDNEIDVYEKHLALFYFKLQPKYLLPSSVIQYICEEFEEMLKMTSCSSYNSIKNKLNTLELNEYIIETILENITDVNPFQSCNSKLNTDYLRKTYFKQNFNYVCPVEVYLGKN